MAGFSTVNLNPLAGMGGSPGFLATPDLALPFSNPWQHAKPDVPLEVTPPSPTFDHPPVLQTQDNPEQLQHHVVVEADDGALQAASTQSAFYQDHPYVTGVGALALAYFLVRNYTNYSITGSFKSILKSSLEYMPTKMRDYVQSAFLTAQEQAKEEESEFKAHFDELHILLDRIAVATSEDIPQIYEEICRNIRAQADVYEAKVRKLTDAIDALKLQMPLTEEQHEQLLALIESRNKIFRAFKTDVAVLDGLMEYWHVRQMPSSDTTLREIEERYFHLENNFLKAIPMFAYNYLNTFSTVMIGTFVMLSAFNMGLPHLADASYCQEFLPDVFQAVPKPHAHWSRDNLISVLGAISLFSLGFDFFYAGYKGLRSRNISSRPARAWNTILHILGFPYRAVEAGLDYAVNSPMQSLFGKPWQIGTRYLYRASSLGAMGIVRQIGRDITFRPNDLIPLRIQDVGVFGKMGDVTFGHHIGGIFDWSVGVFENVMQNVIVKTPGDSLAAKVTTALQDPFGLLWHNAAPSAACNYLHGYATANVTQYTGNDDMDVVMSRLVLGVIKGSLLTALVSTAAINGDAEMAIAAYLGAQVFIGGNSIIISMFMVHEGTRERVSNFFGALRAKG